MGAAPDSSSFRMPSVGNTSNNTLYYIKFGRFCKGIFHFSMAKILDMSEFGTVPFLGAKVYAK
jgi:hypothetical protein